MGVMVAHEKNTRRQGSRAWPRAAGAGAIKRILRAIERRQRVQRGARSREKRCGRGEREALLAR